VILLTGVCGSTGKLHKRTFGSREEMYRWAGSRVDYLGIDVEKRRPKGVSMNRWILSIAMDDYRSWSVRRSK
jgi:hypothetical protein